MVVRRAAEVAHQEEAHEFLEEEIKCYEKILNCGEEAYYFVWFYKAEAHEELGQIGEAILCYARFIELCDEEDQEDLEDGARTQIIKLSNQIRNHIRNHIQVLAL